MRQVDTGITSLLLGIFFVSSGFLALGFLFFAGRVPEVLFVFWVLLFMGMGLFFVVRQFYHSRLTVKKNHPLRCVDSLDQSGDLVFWVSCQGLVSDVNDTLVQTLGFDRTTLVGHGPQLFFPRFAFLQREEFWAPGQRLPSFEAELKKNDHTLVYVVVTVRMVTGGAEEFLCFFCRDITVEKDSYLKEQKAREMFETYLEGLPVGAFLRDHLGQFVYFNRQFKRWNPQVSIGKTSRDIFDVQKAEEVAKEDRLVLEQGPAVFWAEDTLDDFERHFFEVHKFPVITPDQLPLVGGICFDVTVRKASEQRLLENQAFLEAVINQSPVGIIILDGNTTNIIICNNGAKEIIGIPMDENLSGKTISFDGLIWEVLNPDGTPPPLEQNPLYKAFFHESTSNDKMLLRRMDGNERFVMINSGPIYDNEGKFIAAIVAFLDITELRDAQEQLEELNKRLEQIVSDRTRELMESNAALKVTIENLRHTQEHLIESEKMASLGSLVAGVAHEINTPVGVGVTAASFLKEKTCDLEKQYKSGEMRKSDLESYLQNSQQSAGIILANLERASNLIKSFKMISVDQSTDQRRTFKPFQYFQDLFVSLHPPDKRLHLKIDIQGDCNLSITSYPGAYSQILTNLYMNSCIHAFENMTEGEIRVQFQKKGKLFHLSFSDNGRGMEEHVMKRIYDPFFTTRRDLGGTGLGMNIVFNLVSQKLGGTIKTVSKLGEGTKFIFDLPLEPPRAETDLPSIIQ